MNFFRLDASLRTAGSVSRRLADAVEEQWRQQHPNSTVTRRDVGQQPLPPLWPAGVSLMELGPDQQPSAEQAAAKELSAELVDELLAADAYLFAVPIYNWGVPQNHKHWIDMVILDPRTRVPDGQLLAGRPAVVVEARGGGYAPGTPRHGWDHATPFLTHVLGDLWGLDLSFARAELTLADINPAMAHLRDLATTQLSEAESAAAGHGAQIARRLRASA
jgi:FMN-dependent NADH-azoreductase